MATYFRQLDWTGRSMERDFRLAAMSPQRLLRQGFRLGQRLVAGLVLTRESRWMPPLGWYQPRRYRLRVGSIRPARWRCC
jgi:hypothetical protein